MEVEVKEEEQKEENEVKKAQKDSNANTMWEKT